MISIAEFVMSTVGHVFRLEDNFFFWCHRNTKTKQTKAHMARNHTFSFFVSLEMQGLMSWLISDDGDCNDDRCCHQLVVTKLTANCALCETKLSGKCHRQ